MHRQPLTLLALALTITPLWLAPLWLAHGKITYLTGDQGGNTTALGILGAIVPNTGPNSVTEVDTTVFKKAGLAVKSDGLGETAAGGPNRVEDVWIAGALSGGVLPRVSRRGGFVRGEWHVVVSDGAGPVKAVVDPTATGNFSKGVEAEVVLDVPGNQGNINPDGAVPRSLLLHRAIRSLARRAKTVNRDYPMEIAVPAGITCTGQVAGQDGVCFMKIANENRAGPFGGVVAFQIVDGDGTANNGSAALGAVNCTHANAPVGNARRWSA